MPARANSSGYVFPDHLQIILRDAHCEQCLGTRPFLRYLPYDTLSDDVGDTSPPPF